MHERPPPAAAETDGAATDPTRRIRSPRRRPARGSRPPHASRPRSTPAKSSRQGNPGTPARRPRTTAATANASEPYRSHRARKRIVVSTDGSVSSCRMPVSGSSVCISGPALQAGPRTRVRPRSCCLSCPAQGRQAALPPDGLQPQPHCRQAAGGPGPRRFTGHGPVRAPMPAAHPAIRRQRRQATSRRPRRRAAAALRVPATVLFRHHRNRTRRRSRAPSSIQPCENASRGTGDVAEPSARRTAFAAEHPARSAPPHRGPPRRRQSRPTRGVHPSGPPPGGPFRSRSFLFFMTAGFAGAGR